jgi:hypothetical protein
VGSLSNGVSNTDTVFINVKNTCLVATLTTYFVDSQTYVVYSNSLTINIPPFTSNFPTEACGEFTYKAFN